jgi:hypothetical protein
MGFLYYKMVIFQKIIYYYCTLYAYKCVYSRQFYLRITTFVATLYIKEITNEPIELYSHSD